MPREIAETIIIAAICIVFMLCYFKYASIKNANYLLKFKEIQSQPGSKVNWTSTRKDELQGIYEGYKISLRLIATTYRSPVYEVLEIRMYGNFPKLRGFIVEYPEVEKGIQRSDDSLFCRLWALESYPENLLAPVVIRKLNILASNSRGLETNGV